MRFAFLHFTDADLWLGTQSMHGLQQPAPVAVAVLGLLPNLWFASSGIWWHFSFHPTLSQLLSQAGCSCAGVVTICPV